MLVYKQHKFVLLKGFIDEKFMKTVPEHILKDNYPDFINDDNSVLPS